MLQVCQNVGMTFRVSGVVCRACCGMTLSLLLFSCGPKIESSITHTLPDGTIKTMVPVVFEPLKTQEIDFGYTKTKDVQDLFGGFWNITKKPDWLSVSEHRGQGNVNTTLTVKRGQLDDITGSQSQLTGDILVEWSSPEGDVKGTSTWKVSADMFRLEGQIVRPRLTSSGTDVAVSGKTSLSAQATRQARGLLVTYRDMQLRNAALETDADSLNTLETLSVSEQRLRKQAQTSLTPLASLAVEMKPEQVNPLGQRSVFLDIDLDSDTDETKLEQVITQLQQNPSVLQVTRNATLTAQQADQQTAQQQAIKAEPKLLPVFPTDQYSPNQWAFQMMGYPAVWRDMTMTAYKKPVTVAVIDTGIRYEHPDLAGKLLTGKQGALDVVPKSNSADGDGIDNDPTDPAFDGRSSGSHGTHVTGIIAANWGKFKKPCPECSDSGVIGAVYNAPIKILPIRALDSDGNVNVSEVINAVRYSAGLPIQVAGKTYKNPSPAKILNMSLGGPISAATALPMCDAISEVRKKGVLVFAAAGNQGTSSVFYPAGCADAVSVASTTLSGSPVASKDTFSSAPKRSNFSNYYAQVELSAPGGSGTAAGQDNAFFNGSFFNKKPMPDEIMSTNWDYVKNTPNYSSESGTSQATPQVSALAALMLSKGVTSGAEDTLKRLIETATDLGAKGRDHYFGYGMINAAAALNAPRVAQTFGLRVQNQWGKAYQPRVLPDGKFTSYVEAGTYTVVFGEDKNGNNIYGEFGEKAVRKTALLDEQNEMVDVGVLQLK